MWVGLVALLDSLFKPFFSYWDLRSFADFECGTISLMKDFFRSVMLWLECYDKIFTQNFLPSSIEKQLLTGSLLKKFTKLLGKYLCRSLFLIIIVGSVCNFIKKRDSCFPVNFFNTFKNTFLTEHLCAAASVYISNFGTTLNIQS